MACSYRQCCGESTLKRTTIHRRDFQYRQCFSELDRLVFSKLAQRIISSADIAILTVRHGFTVADEKEAGCGQERSLLLFGYRSEERRVGKEYRSDECR